MKNYLKNRNRAMDWMKSEKHDFAQGIAILKDAGFKPGVVGVLERHGSGRNQSDERLMYHMRDFIRCFANSKAKEDTDIIIGVVEGKELQPDSSVNDNIPSMLSDGVREKLEAGTYPGIIAEIISSYREAFVEREKLVRQLAELPENNDEEIIEKRRKISDEMKELSDIMDKIYPQYEAYITCGNIPNEGTSEENNNKSSHQDPESSVSSTGGSNEKADLQKQRKSIVTKISRAKNMLLYQKETKQEQENPLTDPKKVAKYQAKIDSLTKELYDIDMQIAALA